MKKIILALIILLPSLTVFSQDIEHRDGKYYQGDKLYTGKYLEYYGDKDNLKSEKEIKDGLAHGDAYQYYENGDKMEHGVYKNGLKDGPWTTWDENGTKRAEMYYKEGNKSGTWRKWDGSGELISEENH